MICAEPQVEHGDLTEEIIKAKDVKCVILGNIPDMGKSRFVRMRGSIKEVEIEETAIVKLVFDEGWNLQAILVNDIYVWTMGGECR